MSIERGPMKSTSIPGKPYVPSLWKLEVRCWPVLTDNGRVCDIKLANDLGNLSAHDMIYFHVMYDDEILHGRPLPNNHLVYGMLDDKNKSEHEISVWISNKDSGHTSNIDGRDISICVACEILIEDLVVTNFMTGGGMLLLGVNDEKTSIKVTTPIYRWLLGHMNGFFKPYPPDPIQQIIKNYL